MVGLLGFLAIAVLVLGGQFWFTGRPKRAVMNQQELRQDVIEAFREQKPLPEGEIAQEVMPMLQDLGEALLARDQRRIGSHFDMERLVDELISLEVFPNEIRRQRRGLVDALRDNIGKAMEKQAPLINWTKFEIKNVKKLAGHEAAVIVRHTHPEGATLKFRWWLIKRQEGWKVFDTEDLDIGMRWSNSIASLEEMGFNNISKAVQGMIPLRDALHALALQQDVDTAEKKLKQIEGIPLPKKWEALRYWVIGQLHLHKGQAEEALTALDKAHSFNGDMPAVDLFRGFACNNLGQWDRALKHLEAYRALLGEDAQVCHEIGVALAGLSRFQEACVEYRKALDDDPKNSTAFLSLVRGLGQGENRDDLGARFAKLDNPHLQFDICADDCRQTRNGDSLEALALAMGKIDPQYAPADFFLIQAKVWKGQADQAVPLFQAYLVKEKDPNKRQGNITEFLQVMANAGKPLEAYLVAPDAREAFRLLAGELQRNFRSDLLSSLVTAHAKKHADDPLLPLFEGEMLTRQGKYQLAEKAFEKGLAKEPDQKTREQFLSSRVLVKYHTGQILTAYQTLGPPEKTFSQLANLCLQDKKFQELEALLKEHAKAHPESLEVLQVGYRLQLRQNHLAEGIALFQKALQKQTQPEQKNNLVDSFLFDMIDAGKAVEGYRAAPDGLSAFKILAEDLLDQGNWKDFRLLLEAHRQRHPEDIWLSLYTGQLHLEDKDWAKAATVLKAGWQKAPAEVRQRFHYNLVFALYKTDQTMQAYAEITPRKETFLQLANLLGTDKKAKELLDLVAAHRPNAPEDPDLLYYEARAKIFMREIPAAEALLQQAYQKQTQVFKKQEYVNRIVADMDDIGQGIAGYRTSPDKLNAFRTLAGNFWSRKKTKELEDLLKDHRHNHPKDPQVLFYQGELELLRGEFQTAEQNFAAALKSHPQDSWLFRNGLFRARVKAGKVVQTYHEFGKGIQLFEDLANLCLAEKNVPHLQALIAAHHQAQPEEYSLDFTWNVEIQWLNQDYEGVLKILTENQQEISKSRYRWKCENFMIRCLVKLQKPAEAIREAETLIQAKQGNLVLLVLAHAASGDVQQTIKALENNSRDRFLLEDCYRDLDLGPILRSEPFRAFQQKYPEPKEVRDLR